jgi:hypothetical protein
VVAPVDLCRARPRGTGRGIGLSRRSRDGPRLDLYRRSHCPYSSARQLRIVADV